jgi:hypothetical protein
VRRIRPILDVKLLRMFFVGGAARALTWRCGIVDLRALLSFELHLSAHGVADSAILVGG